MLGCRRGGPKQRGNKAHPEGRLYIAVSGCRNTVTRTINLPVLLCSMLAMCSMGHPRDDGKHSDFVSSFDVPRLQE